MRAADLLRWIAVLCLGAATLYIYRPIYSATSAINLPGYEAIALADSIVTHKSFSDPFMPLATGPSAHLAPLYPAYLALIIKVFGQGAMGVGALMWATTLMLAAQLMLLPILARHLGIGFWTGVLAALAWLAAAIPPTFLAEATLVSLLVVSAVFLMRTSFGVTITVSQILTSGALWGALLLVQPVVILVLVGWLLLLHCRSQRSLGQKIALGVVPIILVTPWIVRNFAVFHKPVFIRDNLGIELVVSNNPCASFLFDLNQSSGCYSLMHPNLSYEEALKVRQLGEVEYNQVRLHEAIDWIRANPKAFAHLSVQRFEAFWIPPASSRPGNGVLLRPWVLHCFTLLSLPGLFFMWKNARFSAYVTVLWLLFFPVIYYFVQFLERYRYPILWATFLPGSYFLTELARGILGKQELQGARAQITVSNSEAG
jgi:hypothetical protein